jgi:hypothetical protein
MNEETNQIDYREFNYSFNLAEVNYIISGLQELPTKIAVPIINKIHAQYNAQQAILKQQQESKE